MADTPDSSAHSDTVHDFLTERLILKVIGCITVLNTSRLHFALNIIYLVCSSLLLVYILAMSVYTLTIPNTEPGFKVQIYQILSVLSVGFAVPSMAHFYMKNYTTSIYLLKNSFNKYVNEVPDSEHEKLKRQRVDQIRLWSFLFCTLCYMVATFYILRPPLKYVFIAYEENPNDVINSYLPLPLFVPFDTRNTTGYTIAFLSNALYLLLLYSILSCFTETYLSSALQLLAQMEIFNHSLIHIKSRATLKFNSENNIFPGRPIPSVKSENQEEFQRCLCLCLKASIQHHQAILRYYQEVKDYLGAMNTFCILIFAVVFASSMVTVIHDPLGSLALIIHLMTELTGYFELFMVGQVITDESKNAINSLYSTPWTTANRSYRIMLNIMLTTAKKPIILRAPFFNADWTLETFGAMLSGAYKLVNVMLNTL